MISERPRRRFSDVSGDGLLSSGWSPSVVFRPASWKLSVLGCFRLPPLWVLREFEPGDPPGVGGQPPPAPRDFPRGEAFSPRGFTGKPRLKDRKARSRPPPPLETAPETLVLLQPFLQLGGVA